MRRTRLLFSECLRASRSTCAEGPRTCSATRGESEASTVPLAETFGYESNRKTAWFEAPHVSSTNHLSPGGEAECTRHHRPSRGQGPTSSVTSMCRVSAVRDPASAAGLRNSTRNPADWTCRELQR
eukprot:9306239-Alexandrium_andersonii.AAC.1